MKKILTLFIVLVISFTLCSCEKTSKEVNSLTYNGITKTETVTTNGDKTDVKVEYTDENGKVLDEEEGKAAFEAAQKECEEVDTISEEKIESESESEEAITEEEVISATLNFMNDTDVDITGLYLVLSEADDWGNNILNEDLILSAGTSVTSGDGALTYTPSALWKMKISDSNGNEIAFEDFCFGKPENPIEITIVIEKEDDVFTIEIQ